MARAGRAQAPGRPHLLRVQAQAQMQVRVRVGTWEGRGKGLGLGRGSGMAWKAGMSMRGRPSRHAASRPAFVPGRGPVRGERAAR
jgi:hypothetical protein